MAHSPGDGTHTDSEAPWVEGVPGEVGHRRAVLDGGHGCVGETAGLGELRERAKGVTCTAPTGAAPATVLCRGYLEDGDLAAGREQGEGNTLVVGAEAVALARRGEAEPPQVGEVGVAVQHPALRVPEAGAGPWRRRGTGERPGSPLARPQPGGCRAHPAARSPKMLWSDFWLGLLAKPLEGPVLAEREVAALPGEASEDGEE